MLAARSLALCAAALLLAAAASPAPGPRRAARLRRQLADDDALQPLEDAAADEQTREKRKLEGVTQAKFGIKNAVLGFVFGKINSLIDAKTRLVDQLDRQNIALNKQYGIEPPQSGLASLSGVVGQVVSGIGPKLQLLGPKIQAVTGLLGGASGGASGGGGAQGGGGLGSILSLVTSLSGSSSGGAGAGATVETIDSSEEDEAHRLLTQCCTCTCEPSNKQTETTSYSGTTWRRRALASSDTPSSWRRSPRSTRSTSSNTSRRSRPSRQAAPADDIPEFDRNKVSLDLPGNLFGPSVSLLIRTTKIIGDVIQNSAVRYQTFLRLFRPLFRGPFEIKGLDPPTTTTTTTTTTPAPTTAQPTADNEVRRR